MDGNGRVFNGGGLSLGSTKLSDDVSGQGADDILAILSGTGIAVGGNITSIYSTIAADASGRATAGIGSHAIRDVSGTAAGLSITLSLAQMAGVQAGTYLAVVIDSRDRVTNAQSLQQASFTNALGFTQCIGRAIP